MNDAPNSLIPVVRYLKQASALLRAATLAASQDSEMRGASPRLQMMSQETIQFADHIISYFTSPM